MRRIVYSFFLVQWCENSITCAEIGAIKMNRRVWTGCFYLAMICGFAFLNGMDNLSAHANIKETAVPTGSWGGEIGSHGERCAGGV
jgi:hypothetical protein